MSLSGHVKRKQLRIGTRHQSLVRMTGHLELIPFTIRAAGLVTGNGPLPYPVWLAPSRFEVYDVFSVESSRSAALVVKG